MILDREILCENFLYPLDELRRKSFILCSQLASFCKQVEAEMNVGIVG